MRRVRSGDKIAVDGKIYVFSKFSARLFNIALQIRTKEGAWPQGSLVVDKYTKAGSRPHIYNNMGCFSISTVARAVKKAQKEG